jgi:RND family efflux transporter MFP subunit
MFNAATTALAANKKGLLPSTSPETKQHFAKLMTASGIAMFLILPIGIIPRIMQAQELNQVHEKIVNQLPLVSATPVALAPTQQKISLPGTIEAIVETPVFARSNGYVQERFVDIGDHVAAGQLLAKMETPEMEESEKEAKAQFLTTLASKEQTEANRNRAKADLDTAIAQLSQARAALIERQSTEVFAKSTMQRWKSLGKEGAVSAQEVDEKETNYQTSLAARQAADDFLNAAKSGVVAARARLNAEEASVSVSSASIAAASAHADRSSTERGFQNVTSPFAGIITERNIDQGTLISSGSDNSKLPLFRLARIDIAKVFVDVPQYAARGVHIGEEVNVTLKEFPGKTFAGKVARTSFALDATARTLRTEIHIPNPDLALIPGMYADVNFSMARPGKTFIIPANSLIVRAEGPQVVTLSNGKNIHYRQVKLGEDLGKEVEVVEGLNNDDTVVINPSDILAEGASVAVNPQ